MVSLQNILLTGLILSFILPGMALVSSTLPPPIINGVPNVTIAAQLGETGNITFYGIGGVINAVNGSVLGNNTGLNANPISVQAFAFTIEGLGTIVTEIVQLPIIDYNALQFLLGGLGSILPGAIFGFVRLGTYLLYLYMAFSMVILGMSAVMKYNFSVGS